MTKPPVIAIVGPTGVGKTALSLALAERFPVEIVSVDSRQVYRGMDIGTAKPTPEEQASVPHHLIDVVEPTEEFSLAVYLDMARSAIRDVQARGKTPLLVGGTGQYLWALLEDWRVPAVAPDHDYRQELAELARSQGVAALHPRLAEVAPPAAARIDARNARRVIRALEVCRQTGSRWSELRCRGEEPYRSLVMGLTLPREQLYHRIDRRVEQMVGDGWVDEVERLLERGVGLEQPCMASVGYREMAAHLAGDVALDDAIRNIKADTHGFARHQYAWFRLSDPRIRWLVAANGVEGQAEEMAREFLG